MNWKVDLIKREENRDLQTYSLSLDSIGWFVKNYHTDKIMRDIIYNLAKKIYLSENKNYIVKLNSLPDNYEVDEKIEEFEIMFQAIEKRSKK